MLRAQHAYYRYYPVTNAGGVMHVDTNSASADNHTYVDPLYQVAIVAGAPGNIEVNPASCKIESAEHKYPRDACSTNYGYGHVQVVNATHLHWTWFTTVREMEGWR